MILKRLHIETNQTYRFTLKSILSFLLLCNFGTYGIFAQDRKPNVVFILADDLGWADLPIYGNQFNEAPNITQLAKDGVRFTNAYAASPVCSPSRASIMSGQYPARVGINDFIPGQWRPYEEVIVPRNRDQFLRSELVTIGEIMKSGGYETGYFGKWHLGNKQQHHPLHQGFSEANVGNDHYGTIFDPPRQVLSGQRFSESITDFGTAFIEKNKDKPFFLFLAHYDVHLVLDAETDLIKKYTEKAKVKNYPSNPVYAAMIEHLDNSVGRIRAKLKELGLEKDTIIIFFSDNGGLRTAGNKGYVVAESKRYLLEDKKDSLLYIATENTPLRNEKGTVYEGGIRVPLIIKWAGQSDESSISDEVISSIDFFPTLAEIAQVPLPKEQIIDGKSLFKTLNQSNCESDRAVFWHYPVYHHGVPSSAVRKGNWKLIRNLVDSTQYLFDLRDDIGESKNLIESEPQKTRELSDLLSNWSEEVGAEIPIPNPDFDIKNRAIRKKHPDLKK